MITPQIEGGITNITENISIPSKTYKATDERIAGFVDGKEAVRQAVAHILKVERYSCEIYDTSYGVELNQYVGQSLDYIRATIEDTLKEALTQDTRILDVLVTDIDQLSIDTVNIKFTVTSSYGDIQMEVDLSV